jgi:hypothetical protein
VEVACPHWRMWGFAPGESMSPVGSESMCRVVWPAGHETAVCCVLIDSPGYCRHSSDHRVPDNQNTRRKQETKTNKTNGSEQQRPSCNQQTAHATWHVVDVLLRTDLLQRPPYQGGHNGRELGHGTFCGVLSAVRLGLRLPSIFRRRRSFFLGFAGWA